MDDCNKGTLAKQRTGRTLAWKNIEQKQLNIDVDRLTGFDRV